MDSTVKYELFKLRDEVEILRNEKLASDEIARREK
jgi:hypothetical protein